MTGLGKKELRLVEPDLRALTQVANDWAAERGLQWDPFCAHLVVPAWEEAVRDCTDLTVLDTNERSLVVSDALIVHAFDDGSAMVGWLINSALRRAHVVPVLVVAHKSETLSKAFLALQQRFDSLSFSAFEDDMDLFRLTQGWLEGVEGDISSGPERRRALESVWQPTQAPLRDRWAAASADVRRSIIGRTGLSESWLNELLTEPLLVADLPSHTLAVLIDALEVDAARAAVIDEAQAYFDPVELEAWRYWARDKGSAYARHVLESALKERTDGRVAHDSQLGQPGAWDRYASHWRSGQVGE